jgi:hypothetical protein
MGGGAGTAEVRKKDQHAAVRTTNGTTVYAMQKLGWLRKDPNDSRKKDFRYIQDRIITPAGREVLKLARAARRASGKDQAVIVAWDRSAGSAAPYKVALAENRERLEAAAHDVAALLCIDSAGRSQRGTEELYPDVRAQGAAYFLPESVHALRNLRAAIQAAVLESYQAGHRKGASLALSMAAGDMTAREYNEAATKVADRS